MRGDRDVVVDGEILLAEASWEVRTEDYFQYTKYRKTDLDNRHRKLYSSQKISDVDDFLVACEDLLREMTLIFEMPADLTAIDVADMGHHRVKVENFFKANIDNVDGSIGDGWFDDHNVVPTTLTLFQMYLFEWLLEADYPNAGIHISKVVISEGSIKFDAKIRAKVWKLIQFFNIPVSMLVVGFEFTANYVDLCEGIEKIQADIKQVLSTVTDQVDDKTNYKSGPVVTIPLPANLISDKINNYAPTEEELKLLEDTYEDIG